MANNKLYGFQPEYRKAPELVAKLNRLNPFEFRKGMDYELTKLGCLSLMESTPEEREKSTNTVIKNLEEHQGYYTALITYETTYKTAKNKPAFKTWLKEQDNQMKPVSDDKMGKIKDAGHKNDKMTEPKYDKKEYTKTFETSALKESIKSQIKKTLLEKKEDDEDNDKEAEKGAKKGSKKLSIFDKERELINKLLEDIIVIKDKKLDVYKKSKKDKKAVETYKESIKLSEKEIKKYEKAAEKFEVSIEEYIGKEKTIPSTIKSLEKRLKAIDKEEEEAVAKLREEKKEIAITDMTREEQIRLLNIIRENGISLNEGSDNIKTYYEIAKTSFLEGLAKGLQL